MPSGLLAVDDDGQPNADGLALDLSDVEAVAVAGVAEEERLHVERLLLFGMQRPDADECQQQEEGNMPKEVLHCLRRFR